MGSTNDFVRIESGALYERTINLIWGEEGIPWKNEILKDHLRQNASHKINSSDLISKENHSFHILRPKHAKTIFQLFPNKFVAVKFCLTLSTSFGKVSGLTWWTFDTSRFRIRFLELSKGESFDGMIRYLERQCWWQHPSASKKRIASMWSDMSVWKSKPGPTA